jgi:glycerophosphoryl diester phosphodiesterase
MAAKLSAHRGGPEGRYEPNTVATIRSACELGVDLVEFDVRIAADGTFVVGHDNDLRDRPNPTRLDDVLDVIAGRAMGHVDLKEARREVEIADLCIARLGVDGFIVTTNKDASVQRLRKARPQLRVGLTLGRHAVQFGAVQLPIPMPGELYPWRRLRRCGANLVAVDYRLARLGILAGAHRRGLPVLLWTLNRPALILAAQHDDRVWAYTTDYPRLARQLQNDGPAGE